MTTPPTNLPSKPIAISEPLKARPTEEHGDPTFVAASNGHQVSADVTGAAPSQEATASPEAPTAKHTESSQATLAYQIVDGDPLVPSISSMPPRSLRVAAFAPGGLPPIPLALHLTEPKTHQPGIIVCEPVSNSKVDDASSAFAAGCGDYLDFEVGGQPLLGQTPALMSVSRALRELKLKAGLRLSLTDAVHVAQITGATKVAIGNATIGKKAGDICIEYSIYDVATSNTIGSPITIAGSSTEVLRALPTIAYTMVRRLGVASPRTPRACGLSSAEVAALGRVFWTNNPAVADAKVASVAAQTDPLAMICAISQERSTNQAKLETDVHTLLTKLAPENALAWGETAVLGGSSSVPLLSQVEALRAKFPDNYCLAYADFWMSHAARQSKGMWQASLAELRNAPNNPEAWIAFGYAVSSQSNSLRQWRYISQLTRADRSRINSLYSLWEYCEIQATLIDPQHDTAWSHLISAAIVAGDKKTGVDAFPKAEMYYSGPKNLDSEMVYPKQSGSHEQETLYGGLQGQNRRGSAA